MESSTLCDEVATECDQERVDTIGYLDNGNNASLGGVCNLSTRRATGTEEMNSVLDLGQSFASENNEKLSFNLSRNLRFGIEAILKVKAEVTEKLKDKKCENDTDKREIDTEKREKDIEKSKFEVLHSPKNNSNGLIENENALESDDESSEEALHTALDEDTDPCFPYVRLPASFQGMRPTESPYMTSQNMLPVGRLGVPWSQAVLNDLRKERFGRKYHDLSISNNMSMHFCIKHGVKAIGIMLHQ